MKKLENKTVFITGGLSGIGRACAVATAALEYAADGIRVNAICPGFIETPLLTKDGVNDNEKKRNQFKALHPLNRFGKSDEIAKGFIFLATDDSAFKTGSALEMDGGYLAQ